MWHLGAFLCVEPHLNAVSWQKLTVRLGSYLNEFSSFKAMGNLLKCHVGLKHLFL